MPTCKTWFTPQLQFANKEAFDATTVTGGQVDYPYCRRSVCFTEENMRWIELDGQGSLFDDSTR